MKIIIAHAEDEEAAASPIAEQLSKQGYDVFHRGTVVVGESVIEEASKALNAGGPIILCGTVKAVGTGWAHKLINAARHNNAAVRILALQMEKDAYLQQLALDSQVSQYWRDPSNSLREIMQALEKFFPTAGEKKGISNQALRPNTGN